jgi:GAF domain-containing protein
VIDSQPRHWTSHQVHLLSDIAASVITEITLAQSAGKELSTAEGPAGLSHP